MHRVVVLAVADVVAFDLAIAAQVFGSPARDLGERRYAFAVCAAAPGAVRTSTGFSLLVDHGLEALTDADTVIVPGVDDTEDAAPAEVLEALRAAHGRGARIVSICTGAFVLAAAELLAGRRATTHWQYAALLARRYPAVEVDPDVLYVDDGDVLTSAGVAAGIDLCLHIVRCDHGADVANAIARRIVVAPHRDGGQAQFAQRPVPAAAGSGLSATREWMLERLHEPLTVARLASHAGYAERSFARIFRAETGMSPLQWLISQRVLEARRLLESTALPVEDVAARSGFGSAASLRQHLRRQAATTPTAYRGAFRSRS
ncbi:MAG: AraC family transcriptional regulator [Solirubrobacterales bacterium]|jgi:transcriptional regulator GlxA family with amidase domain|nr:AraC family transcriptional regulator [Solirubrobacterales bacterium]